MTIQLSTAMVESLPRIEIRTKPDARRFLVPIPPLTLSDPGVFVIPEGATREVWGANGAEQVAMEGLGIRLKNPKDGQNKIVPVAGKTYEEIGGTYLLSPGLDDVEAKAVKTYVDTLAKSRGGLEKLIGADFQAIADKIEEVMLAKGATPDVYDTNKNDAIGSFTPLPENTFGYGQHGKTGKLQVIGIIKGDVAFEGAVQTQHPENPEAGLVLVFDPKAKQVRGVQPDFLVSDNVNPDGTPIDIKTLPVLDVQSLLSKKWVEKITEQNPVRGQGRQ